MRTAAGLLAIIPCLVVSGCGTWASLQSDIDVYGGVRRDSEVAADFLAVRKESPEKNGTDVRPMATCFAMAAMADVPLSIVADTVMLPLTVPLAIMNYGSEPATKPQSEASSRRNEF